MSSIFFATMNPPNKRFGRVKKEERGKGNIHRAKRKQLTDDVHGAQRGCKRTQHGDGRRIAVGQ
jgi:hypothetical protein